jgi:uncharacterized protein (DUF2141 family)
MRLSFFKVLSVLILLSLFFNCARRGTPTGGPKDSIPPVLTKAIPLNETVNFKDKKIKIYFDEYIKLKDVKTQLIISPPQKNEPIIAPAGTASKFISITILDTLDVNTTYSYNFGNSIVDNNEENKLGNFKYVFSTGTYIDSLVISGEVTDPKVKEPSKNLDVMLYEYDSTFTDSVIFKQKPRYISNTLDSTLFEITNIRKGKYLLIALKDANNNKIYDPDIDKIGFVKDTLTLPTNDTIFNISIFKEVPKLKVIKPKEVSKGHLIFGFKGKAEDLIIKLLSETPENFKSEINYEKGKDTINYWYTPFETDSLNFTASKGDYIEEFTANLRSSKIDTLKITNTGSALNLRDTFAILSNTPIIKVDTSLISIIDKDTLNVDFKAILAKSKNKLFLNFDKKPAFNYSIEILPNAITDIYEIPNDSLSFKIQTKTPEDYGILNVEIVSSKKTSFIVELLNNKNVVVRTAKINKPENVKFELLDPGAYFVRVTIDENNNGIWDTGNFLEKRQPEIIKFFDKILELRANWEPFEIFVID